MLLGPLEASITHLASSQRMSLAIRSAETISFRIRLSTPLCCSFNTARSSRRALPGGIPLPRAYTPRAVTVRAELSQFVVSMGPPL